MPYEAAVTFMQARAAAIAAASERELVWLIEHPPLYTAGTSAKPAELIEARFPVFASGRGGQMTYHGPGQRVAYVMLDLKRRGPDVRRFVATLEEWIIRTLAPLSTCAASGARTASASGCAGRTRAKAARTRSPPSASACTHWVTLHGMALNVDPDLTHFSGIVPCGVSEQRYGVTSLADLGIPVSMPEVDMVLRREFEALFGATVDQNSTENNSPGAAQLEVIVACPRADRAHRRGRRTARAGRPRSSRRRRPADPRTAPRRCRRGDCAPSLRSPRRSASCSTKAR